MDAPTDTRPKLADLLASGAVAVPDPDVEVEPLPPGSLDRWLTDAGLMPDAPPVARSAADSVSVARGHLSTALERLAGIAAGSDTETSDRIAAIREMGRIADTLGRGRQAGAQRAVSEVEAEIAAELRALGWTVTPPNTPSI